MRAFLAETERLLGLIDSDQIECTVRNLRRVRDYGRLFVCGNGGGAGHASHAVCDFRKLGGIEAYAPDNMSELTARINDDGWDTCYENWLAGSHFGVIDGLFVFSVGGGGEAVSRNLTAAVIYAQKRGAWVGGIVGSNGGTLNRFGDPIVVPSIDTPQVEGIQAVLWHGLVNAL